MGIASAIVAFIIIWWLVFFLLLPIGIQSQDESVDGRVHGTEGGAPEKPRIGLKMTITTLIAAGLFILYYAAVQNDWFGITQIIG